MNTDWMETHCVMVTDVYEIKTKKMPQIELPTLPRQKRKANEENGGN